MDTPFSTDHGGNFVSYAQNFEDVMLWRALCDTNKGFYIDIGAQHPLEDSVSKAFYQRGWRGIHVEPIKQYAELLKIDRPDEQVLEMLVSDEGGVSDFFEIKSTGLSTARKDIAVEHEAEGFAVRAIEVRSITMDQIMDSVENDEIHWLKIDVEGYEHRVLSGWKVSAKRPWVVVIEATYPNTQIDTYGEWEYLILQKGYSFVYHDGLNRFYLHEDHLNLKERFAYPPNVFDKFERWRR